MATRKLTEEAELFHEYLRQNGLKKTYQKDLILDTFLGTEGHLSVHDMYALVKKKDRKVGVVTVFRTMKSLTACGIAKEIVLEDGLMRFEHSYHHPAHHHIVCLQCHRAIEYVCPALEKIQDDVIQRYHFQPLHHTFQTYGICEDCRERRPVVDMTKQDTERVFARDAIQMIVMMAERLLEFYRSAARRNQDPTGKDVFERLMRAEEKHVTDLNQELAELLGPEKLLERTPIFLHFDPKALEALVPDLSNYEKAGEVRMDAHASLEAALGLNRKITEFFASYAGRFSETQGKQILLNFAGREEAHAERLQQHIREMRNPSGGASA